MEVEVDVTIALEDELLDDLFPANIHLDRGLRIKAVSPSIRKHYPQIGMGSELFSHFDLPGGNDPDFITCPHKRLKTINLNARCGAFKLAGSIIAHDNGYFLALRHVPTESMFKEKRFQLSEFAPGDPMVQGLLLINLQRAMIEEAQDAALELAFERQRSLDMVARIGRVTGYLARDLNNYLSIIKLNCDRLVREYRGNKRAERILAIIDETVTRSAGLAGPLMQFSHPRADTPMPIAIDRLIEDNRAFLQSVLGPKIALTVNLGIGSAKAMIGHVQILDCLTNLLLNARDTMPNGGAITIATEIRAEQIDCGRNDPATPLREYLAIEIADTGKGMTEAALSHSIEPVLPDKSDSSIFGVASALEFARKMGGDARIDTAPDGSARLCLYFPVATIAEQVSAIPEDSLYDVAGVKGRILLVEGEPFAQEALVELLEAEGYAITACESGEQALLANGHAEHDVLLTDISLPGESGARLARTACERRSSLKVILMSGYMPDKADMRPDWMSIRKPLDSDELLALLSKAVPQPESRSPTRAK